MNSAIVSVINILLWIVGSLALLPLGLGMMRLVWRDRGFVEREIALIAALVTAPFIFSGVLWLGSWYGLISLAPGTTRLAAIFLVLLSVPLLGNSLPLLPRFIKVLVVYFGVFIGWVAFRALTPEIFWGEKPMDFSFLNYLIRSTALPPDDPWAAGHPLNYYYFGHFTWAIFHKLTGIDSGYGYNLALSSIGAGIFAGLWVFLRTLGLTARISVCGAAVIALGSNLEWIRFAALGSVGPYISELTGMTLPRVPHLGFDHFWATSRLLTSPAITEYLSWSVMFGDLHAHLIGLPLSAVCYAMIFRLTIFSAGRSFHDEADRTKIAPFRMQIAPWVLFGALEGVLYATNSWEVIPHFGMLALACFAVLLSSIGTDLLSTVVRLFVALAAMGLGAAIFIQPWLIALGEPVAIGYWWVVADYATGWQLARHFGQFFIPLFCAALVGFVSWPGKRIWIWFAASLFACVLVGMGMYVEEFGHEVPPYTILAGGGVFVFFGLTKLFLRRDPEVGVLLCASGALVGLCELVYVMDHTNTLFKFYLSIWMWLGALAMLAIAHILRRVSLRSLRWPAFAAFALAVIGSAVNVYSLASFQRVEGPRPALNGMLYLPSLSQAESDLIFWMRYNIKGVPVIVEATGDGYREFGRITMNTGLPTVLGWEYHVSQRGVTHDDRRARVAAVNEIYGSESATDVVQHLKRYNVRYVVVGELERRQVQEGRYSRRALEKFSVNPEIFDPVFRSGAAVLYAVKDL